MNLPDRKRIYHREGQPFWLGNCRVQWATELLDMRADGTCTIRKCLLDMETGEEVTTIDAGGYVYHAQPDGAIRIYRAVNEEKTALLPAVLE